MFGLVVVPTPTWYLVLSAVLFSIGAVGVLVRRNPLVMFMCIELMLNAVNLTFVTVGRAMSDIDGQAIVFFVMVVAAAEVVVGLGIIVSIMRRRSGVNWTKRIVKRLNVDDFTVCWHCLNCGGFRILAIGTATHHQNRRDDRRTHT